MGPLKHIKMQSLILWTLIPALALITLASGWRLYRSLYDVILDGFDRKLFALSTTASVFMDGDALIGVLEPYHAQPLAYDAASGVLYSVDAQTGNLLALDAEGGGATIVGPLGVDGVTDLAYADGMDVLFGVAGSWVYRINTEHGAAEKAFDLKSAYHLLGWDADAEDLLVGAEQQAQRINPVTGDIRPWWLDAGLSDITAWTWQPGEPARMLALAGESGMIWALDMERGTRERIGELLPEGTRFGEAEYGEEAGELPAHGLAWNPGDGHAWATADRLMVVDAETGQAEGGLWMATWFRGADNKDYNQIVEPMRRILQRKGVTYMYAFKPGGRKDIVYAVDASSGDDWCPIGFEEELPEQNIEGIHRAITEGVPFISDVLDFDLWGLLKVASAPVYDKDGEHIRALAGVDINISIIRSKTRVALFQVFGIGLAALLLAGAVSVWVTRRLTVPINTLKYGALRLAAGAYDHRIEVRQPRELGQLAQSLNAVGDALEKTMRDMRVTGERMEQGRRRAELARTLAASASTTITSPGLALRWLGDRVYCADASGAVQIGEVTVSWIANPEPDALQAVKKRSDIALALPMLLQDTGVENINRALEPLFHDWVCVWMICDPRTGSVHIMAQSPFTVVAIDKQGHVKREQVSAGNTMLLLSAGSFHAVLSSDRACASLADVSLNPVESTSHVADMLETRLGALELEGRAQKIIGMLVVWGALKEEMDHA